MLLFLFYLVAVHKPDRVLVIASRSKHQLCQENYEIECDFDLIFQKNCLSLSVIYGRFVATKDMVSRADLKACM